MYPSVTKKRYPEVCFVFNWNLIRSHSTTLDAPFVNRHLQLHVQKWTVISFNVAHHSFRGTKLSQHANFPPLTRPKTWLCSKPRSLRKSQDCHVGKKLKNSSILLLCDVSACSEHEIAFPPLTRTKTLQDSWLGLKHARFCLQTKPDWKSQHHSGQANHTNQLQCIAFVALHCILVHHIPFHVIQYSILWLCDFCCIAKDLNLPFCISFVPLHFHCSRALCGTSTVLVVSKQCTASSSSAG